MARAATASWGFVGGALGLRHAVPWPFVALCVCLLCCCCPHPHAAQHQPHYAAAPNCAQLNTNHITLLLSNHLDDEEEGDEAANMRKATKVAAAWVVGRATLAARPVMSWLQEQEAGCPRGVPASAFCTVGSRCTGAWGML